MPARINKLSEALNALNIEADSEEDEYQCTSTCTCSQSIVEHSRPESRPNLAHPAMLQPTDHYQNRGGEDAGLQEDVTAETGGGLVENGAPIASRGSGRGQAVAARSPDNGTRH